MTRRSLPRRRRRLATEDTNLGIVLVAGGLLFVWVATEAGWFGLDSASVAGLPMRPLLAALVILVAIWLWRRRARWH